jgi:effector-binding domain-containing protein
MDVEVAVPVAGWLRVAEDVDVRVLPAVEAVTTLHAGPYPRLSVAYRTLAEWAGEHGCALGGDPRETYLVGPDRAAPQGLRTEVAWPLDSRGCDVPGPDVAG